jgi:hypothetical protein
MLKPFQIRQRVRVSWPYGGRVLALVAAAALGGRSEGVLDPKGPIASAEKMILFDSLGIMLAIVIPTIVATLGVAFWFRSSNTRAPHLPDWEYSGRLELIVWSIPAMTVLLVGGIGWISAHVGRPRGVFPSHHDGVGQYQQRAGACLRHAHRHAGRCRLAVDHGQFERQHDAIA